MSESTAQIPGIGAPLAPQDPEKVWLTTTYQPPSAGPQLTARAVITGMLIGAVMCLSNLYVFFKTGWSLGVTLTACILAFAVWKAIEATKLSKPMGMLENNSLTTVASGAGYMTGGGNMAAFGALLMVTTVRPDPLPLIAWFAVIAALGVFVAIPIKRQLINKESLAFPTGTATAETIRSLHADASAGGDGTAKAKALVVAGLFGGLLAFLRDAKASWMLFNIPPSIALPFTMGGRALKDWTIAVKVEVVLLGAGALMSFRTGWSLLLGGILTYVFLAPALVADGIVTEVSYREIVRWTLWPGAALLVASGLTSFALDWRSVVRTFTGLAKLFTKKKPGSDDDDVLKEIEAPAAWFPAALVVLGPVVVVLMGVLFQIPWYAGVVAVPLAVVMGFVAARVTGETDVTPTKALGPVTQLVFGVITPGNLSGNIMSANVTGGIGLHAADLLTTLKTGWLLGANPRQQLYAQLFGVIAGAIVIVPAFNLLIPDPSVLGSEEWPAPSCLVWAGVSERLAGGLSGLHPSSVPAIVVGAVLGVFLALMEKLAPKKLVQLLPSPAGVGIAMVLPASNAIAMFFGASIAEIVRRGWPRIAERFNVPVASGLIAGESLVGIAVAALILMGVLSK
ncbi:MAG: OPT family oligopeptide transporter [Deltaproteobacteria bacterium]|nr:OPT family oligopeptide transporter [Deltaproteobacteria bacterium]